jgi:flagellar M-ring protein FliF
MEQLKRLLASLTLRQRVTIGAAALGAIALLTGLSRWSHERDFKPLYAGLSQEDAGAVLAKVRESGAEFRLAEGGSAVLVPSQRVAELRLQLAAAGVPKSGRMGFELFDKTNFGVSDFAEQINYHRAVEGELERSVMALSEVEQARVHVTFPKDSVFLESKQPAKASVLVKLRPGLKLAPQNVAAICQLVASAVDTLAPEAVSVVDMNGNLLSRGRKPASPDDPEPSDGALEYRRKIERDLLAKIGVTLEPLLGSDKFRAGVSVDCDFTSGEQSEETFDPAKSVMATSQKTEDMSGGSLASGAPGTASNLPRPTSRPGSGGVAVSRRTESISYQSSRLVRRTRIPQGAVKRVSASLIVDQNVRWEGSGAKARRIVEPPTPERLKSIRDLVAGAIGFSAERGDQLIVETLPFESTLTAGPPAAEPASPHPPAKPDDLWTLLKQKNVLVLVGAGAAVLALLAAAAFLLLRKRRRGPVETTGALQLPASGAASEELGSRLEAQIAEQAAQKKKQETDALNALKLPPVTTKKTEVLTKHLSDQAKKDSTMMAQVLRTWISEPGD